MEIFNITEDVFRKYFTSHSYNNISFVLSQIPNPRLNKRITAMKHYGKVSVVCTRRSTSNLYEPQITDIEYTILNCDLPPSSNILKRASSSRKYQREAIEQLDKVKPELIYCASMDSLMVATMYKMKHDVDIIYEVADLRESFISRSNNIIKKFINYLVRKKEKHLLNYIDLLVVTSPKFYSEYYSNFITRDKICFIPNAPDESVFKKYRHKVNGAFTVGYIGGIRYMDQMKLLVKAATKAECEVFFAGGEVVPGDLAVIKSFAVDNKKIRFLGKYNYEDDAANLYGMADCIYSVYDADNPNVRIALPNKLYEAIVCELPIIVAKNTYLAELVTKFGIGIAVDHKNEDELLHAIKQLRDNKHYYKTLVDNCAQLKQNANMLLKMD